MLTNQPLKTLFQKADLSRRIAKWAMEFGEFNITFQPRMMIKVQVIADFIVEFQPKSSSEIVDLSEGARKLEVNGKWSLFVDGSSNQKGIGIALMQIAFKLMHIMLRLMCIALSHRGLCLGIAHSAKF